MNSGNFKWMITLVLASTVACSADIFADTVASANKASDAASLAAPVPLKADARFGTEPGSKSNARNTPRISKKSAGESFADTYIKGRLDIGLRWGFTTLDEPEKYDPSTEKGFIGTISELQEKDDDMPYNLLISYNITKWFGLGLTWDQLKATAHTGHTADQHNDGMFVTKGPTISAIFSVPGIFDNRFVPYAEVGGNIASAEFKAAYWWGNGYSSPADYEFLGSPKDGRYRNGKHRLIDTEADTAFGLVYGVGAKLYITENLCLDVSYRHINADAESHFYFKIGRRLAGDNPIVKLPLDYSVLACGLRYTF